MKSLFTKEFWEVYTIVFAFVGFIGITIFFSYKDITNHFYVDKNFLRCSYSNVVRVGSDYKFECQKFDVISLGREEINKSNKESFKKVNDHCISFSSNGNCRTVITNYNAIEVKEILSGKKIVNANVLGYLE